MMKMKLLLMVLSEDHEKHNVEYIVDDSYLSRDDDDDVDSNLYYVQLLVAVVVVVVEIEFDFVVAVID
jgi:hypothetical protein